LFARSFPRARLGEAEGEFVCGQKSTVGRLAEGFFASECGATESTAGGGRVTGEGTAIKAWVFSWTREQNAPFGLKGKSWRTRVIARVLRSERAVFSLTIEHEGAAFRVSDFVFAGDACECRKQAQGG